MVSRKLGLIHLQRLSFRGFDFFLDHVINPVEKTFSLIEKSAAMLPQSLRNKSFEVCDSPQASTSVTSEHIPLETIKTNIQNKKLMYNLEL